MSTPDALLTDVRIVGYRLVPPDQLLAHPHNPRRHPASQRETLRASLRAVGWIAPLLQNVQTGHLLDGHARVEEALSAGMAAVPVLDIDVEPAKEGLVLATFDPIAALAVLDRDALDSLMADVQTNEQALQDLMSDLATRARPFEPNYTPPLEPPRAVDDAALAAAETRLETQYQGARAQQAVMCPHCGEEFYLDRDA
jgi:ParB-like chromosome segregation protein Spo0J